MVSSSAKEKRNLAGVFFFSVEKWFCSGARQFWFPLFSINFTLIFPGVNNKQLHEMCKPISLSRCCEYCFIIKIKYFQNN